MPPSVVFPGSTPFIEEAAAELGLTVDPHRIQKLQPIGFISTLVSQAGGHPDPQAILDASAESVGLLQVAELAARKMLAFVSDQAAAAATTPVRSRRRPPVQV